MKFDFKELMKAEGLEMEEDKLEKFEEFKKEMETKCITITGEDFARAVAEVAKALLITEGAGRSLEFVRHSAMLNTVLFFGDEEEKGDE